MMSNNPIQMLEDEHLIIAKVISAVPVLADRLEAGRVVDIKTLHGVIEFLQTFADKCHHDKEEDLLFPALVNKGISKQ
ncbi:MAG: hemerythrin, partial [Candidatus Brocadia sp. AMX2]